MLSDILLRVVCITMCMLLDVRQHVHPVQQSGYPCLTLHGGKDQMDRESTLADFKSDVCNLLIATSVAARGLDVKVSVVDDAFTRGGQYRMHNT